MLSIKDLYYKKRDKKTLSFKENSALKNFEKYEHISMLTVEKSKDIDFLNKKQLIKAKANLMNYNYFLKDTFY